MVIIKSTAAPTTKFNSHQDFQLYSIHSIVLPRVLSGLKFLEEKQKDKVEQWAALVAQGSERRN